jgi:hypothetical protein
MAQHSILLRTVCKRFHSFLLGRTPFYMLMISFRRTCIRDTTSCLSSLNRRPPFTPRSTPGPMPTRRAQPTFGNGLWDGRRLYRNRFLQQIDEIQPCPTLCRKLGIPSETPPTTYSFRERRKTRMPRCTMKSHTGTLRLLRRLSYQPWEVCSSRMAARSLLTRHY